MIFCLSRSGFVAKLPNDNSIRGDVPWPYKESTVSALRFPLNQLQDIYLGFLLNKIHLLAEGLKV